MCRILLPLVCLGTLSLALLAGLGCLDRLATPAKPALPATVNWGDPDAPNDSDEAVEPFQVSVSNETLEHLRSRLRAFRWVAPLEGSGFDYGFNGNFMQKVVSHWLEQYDWRVWEGRINSFGNFRTRIEGLRVHFMRVRPAQSGKRPLPLLILHGWPGSVIEFHKLLPLLTTPDADGLAFDVVAPSIPGYAWSEAPKRRGFSASACARLFHKLMQRLGFSQYYVQGGDWGSIIGHVMAREFPDHVLGFHTNMPVQPVRQPSIVVQTMAGAFLPAGVLFSKADCDKLYPYMEKLSGVIRETGYMHLQSTRPDTIGHALSDSPVGLAAYILEKFSVWTDPENRFAPHGNLVGLKAAFTLDELLTNVMIYWTTGSITSSMRLYKEVLSNSMDSMTAYQSLPSDVPHGVASFAHELARVPERFVRITNPNLLRFADFDHGGHFAAFELPAVMNSEIREFIKLAVEFHQQKLSAAGAKTDL